MKNLLLATASLCLLSSEVFAAKGFNCAYRNDRYAYRIKGPVLGVAKNKALAYCREENPAKQCVFISCQVAAIPVPKTSAGRADSARVTDPDHLRLAHQALDETVRANRQRERDEHFERAEEREVMRFSRQFYKQRAKKH